MATASALLLRLDELLGFGKEHTDDANGERSTGTDPEEDLVRIGGGTLGGESEGEGGGEEVTDGVTLLKYTREETTSFDRNGLEPHGDRVTPHSAHTYGEVIEFANSILLGI